MSFGLSRGRELDPGFVQVRTDVFPPLPDDILQRPAAGYVDPCAWFDDSGFPLEIEIGSGKGTFLLNHAESQPGVNHLGIEYAGEFFYYAADRIRRKGLRNVRMLHTDAVEFLRWRCPTAAARVIHLYYSDPWPKTKHHKNRVIQDAFLAQCFRVLTPGGELRVVTDHDELWAWDEAHFDRWTRPEAREMLTPESAAGLSAGVAPFVREAFTPPTWAEEGQTVGTNYERKMCDAVGKQPYACVLRRA